MIGYKARRVCGVKIWSEAAKLQPGVEKVGAFGCERWCSLQIADLLVLGCVHLTRPSICRVALTSVPVIFCPLLREYYAIHRTIAILTCCSCLCYVVRVH